MLLPICKNYIDSPFHTLSCSNIILLHSRLSILFSQGYHPQSKPVTLFVEISNLICGNSLSAVHPKKAIGRQGFAMASPSEWNRLPQLVRPQNTIIGF